MNIGNYQKQLTESLRYRRYSENTVNSYVACIGKFLQYFENKATKPSEISATDIKKYLVGMSNPATHKAYLCAIKYFYQEVGKQPRKLDDVKFPNDY